MGDAEYKCECLRSVQNVSSDVCPAFPDRDFDALWTSIETSHSLFQSCIQPETSSLAAIIHKHGIVSEYLHSNIRCTLSLRTGNECKSINLREILQAYPGAKIEDEKRLDEGGYLWVNGIRYPMGTGPALESVRRQIDTYLLRIGRAVKVAVNMLALGSETPVVVLEQQLGLLADYVSAAHNRVVIQQVVDEMMESLLQLKSKLIEYALNSSIPPCYYHA